MLSFPPREKGMTHIVAGLALVIAGTGAAAAQEARPMVRLDHVALHVADTQKSIDFYQGAFGLEEIPSPFLPGGPRWLAFAGGLALHLQPGRTQPVGASRRIHFAVTLPSLDPVLVYLRAHQILWVDSAERPGRISRTRTDGVQQIFFQDPDGYWIEVNDMAAR
jgi:lactoylglutathione lyase